MRVLIGVLAFFFGAVVPVSVRTFCKRVLRSLLVCMFVGATRETQSPQGRHTVVDCKDTFHMLLVTILACFRLFLFGIYVYFASSSSTWSW